MAPLPRLDRDAIGRWAGGAVELRGRTQVTGGEVADAVERLDLESVSVLFKRTVPADPVVDRCAAAYEVLVDRANARVGPAMIDVANCAPHGSAQLAAYLTAFEAATGEPPDPLQTEIGYEWATVFVHAQYLGWAAANLGPAVAAGMLDVADTALTRLGDALERR